MESQEKQPAVGTPSPESTYDDTIERGELASIDPTEIPATNKLQRIFNRLDAATGVEARGIERVPEQLRRGKVGTRDYVHMALMWLSINCTANNMTVGIIGPSVYELGLVDAIVCCLFGTMFGSACAGYISSFGPASGNRTLVFARYTMGWYPSKLCVLLNWVIEVGYGLVDCLIAGLILSAVNGGGMTVIVGIIVSALITWVVATFGIRWFHAFERYIWIPVVLVLFVFIGSAGPHFDPHAPSTGSGATLAGNRLSYFFLTASVPLGWAPASADYYVYFPSTASRTKTFFATASGMTVGKLLIEFLGIGLGSGLATTASWSSAFNSSGAGALIVEGYAPLGHFGKFCAVILALGIAANNIAGTYAAALNFQQFASPLAKIPRPIWSTVSVIIYTVCAIAGREHLLSIFQNFLGLIGYWTIVWIALTAEEHVIFRKGSYGSAGYDWDAWNDKSKLPIGAAALFSFLVGWAGAIVGMYQTYYTGPIAALVGSYGADLGIPIGMAWAAIVYPPLRWVELKYVGR